MTITKHNAPPKQEPFELFIGSMGCGTTYCNKAIYDTETRDYKIVAHANDHGVLDWYVSKRTLPLDAVERIERDARRDREKWLDCWDTAYSVAKQYAILLDAMTVTELLDWNAVTRAKRAKQDAPPDLAKLVAEIINSKRCAAAQKFYGLEAVV